MTGGQLLAGLVLGLSMGPACLLTCAPALGVALAGELGRGRTATWTLAKFLAGRLAGYAFFGAAAGGLLGGALQLLGTSGSRTVSAAAALALGAALIVFGARGLSPKTHAACLMARGSKWSLAGFPLLFGLLTGVSPCPPFLLAAAEAARNGSWTGGVALFVGFFAGSSVFLTPALLLGAGSERFRGKAARVASVAAVLIGGFFALGGLRGLAVLAAPPTAGAFSESVARRALPEAMRLVRRDGATFEGYREPQAGETERKLVGFAVRGEAPGYSGAPVPVAVGLSREGAVLRVELLPNLETGAHLALLDQERFVERFRGLTIEGVSGPGRKPDAVTGATVTSRAVAEGVRRAALSLEGPGLEPATRESVWTLPDVGTLIACGLVVLAAVLFPWLTGAVRVVCLAISFGALGVWLGRYFSIADLARVGSGQLPGGAAGADVLLFLVVLLGVTLWRGRIWCTHLCPFGAFSELTGGLCRARARTPEQLARVGRFLPWTILAAVCAAVAWTGRLDAAGAEPFALTFHVLSLKLSPAEAWSAAPAALALAALLIAASLFSARFYCRHLCGAGAAIELVAGAGARADERLAPLEDEEAGRG